MNLNGFELEQRLEALLAEEYQVQGLGDVAGLGKKLKKLAKKVGKVVRKVAPIALGAAGLFFGGKLVKGVLGKAAGAAVDVATQAGQPDPAIAQDAAAALQQAQAAGAVPAVPLPGASITDIAAQVARTVLAQQGMPVNSAQGQQVVREVIVQQAAQPTPLTPVPAPGDTVQEVQDSMPGLSKNALLIGGGVAAAALLAYVLSQSGGRR